MRIDIRPIEQPDIPDVLELLKEFAVFEKLDSMFEVTYERLEGAMFGERAYVEGFLALNETKPVGFTLIFPEFTSFRGQRGYFLEDLFVTASHRGQGIGEMLLRRVAKHAADQGFERIDLVVLDWNRSAVDFYKRLGAVGDEHGRQYKFTDDAFRTLAGKQLR